MERESETRGGSSRRRRRWCRPAGWSERALALTLNSIYLLLRCRCDKHSETGNCSRKHQQAGCGPHSSRHFFERGIYLRLHHEDEDVPYNNK